MKKITINSLYEEIQHNFPHKDFLKNRLTFRIGQILQEHRLISEQRAISLNGGGDYLLHEIPVAILIEGIGNFLENELLLPRSSYLEKLQKGIGTKVLDIIGTKNRLD